MDPLLTSDRRHKSARLNDFDYSSASTYFFTICTADRRFFLGDIEDGEIYLTRTGIQAWEEWDRTMQMRPEVIEHAFIVMPNHVHGLVSIDANAKRENVASHGNATVPPRPANVASHGNATVPPRPANVASHGNATMVHRKPRSLSTLVSGYKGAVTRWIRNELRDSAFDLWQPGYHEHIVRNDGSFETIFGYIVNNPAKWSEDRENPARRESS